MQTERLYLTDAYLREFPARVVERSDIGVVLDRTAFHPSGGGQPDDGGRLRWGTTEAAVAALPTAQGIIVHQLPNGVIGPPPGTAVVGEVDWPRRHSYMRAHTMLHILSGVVYQRFGSGTTGGQISEGRARMDFTLEEFGRPLAEELVAAVNEIIAQDLPVTVRFVTREEAAQRPSLVRVATALPAEVQHIRLIDIEGFDVQADGGTHVRSTAEVGPVVLGKLENKGARNKRLYVDLAPTSSTSSDL
ncbi:MAG: alanyl-tRNA editing protein [Thermoplasmata archaeon]|nr:alanyl-tRNA editing protein [Thermoplasmata archaeon]MCI4354543.1 alanyl-tRNA editing protein [Thermoplasmata archaeon]